MNELRPQPGPQEEFLSSEADIAIIGGANDGGKTFGLLMDSLYHSGNPGYEAVYFRRITSEITNAGGLWREARKIYHNVEWRESPRMQVKFPTGATLTFSHMEHSSDRFSWDGSQIAGLYFDQLESFEEEQFWHLVGRNRSTCGVKPFVRASMNPKPKSWLVNFIQWWWDENTGYPIPERDGVWRWFVRDPNSDKIFWADRPEELSSFTDSKTGEVVQPKSVTFIFATVYDNKIALALDPGRLTNLLQLPFVERERRLRGNMLIEDITGDGLIHAEWWKDKIVTRQVWELMDKKELSFKRGWDTAGGETKGADYTAGVLTAKHKDGRRFVVDVARGKWSPNTRDVMMKSVLKSDQDKYGPTPQYAWKSRTNDMNRSVLASMDYAITLIPEKGSKLDRAKAFFAPAVEAGNYYLVEGEWNAEFIMECARFTGEDSTETRKDDQVDAVVLSDKMQTQWN